MENLINRKSFFIILFLFCVVHNCFSYSSGLENSGLENSGLEKSGLENSGLENSGLENSGLENSGLEKLSGISVVVGNEIVLDSEIKNRNEEESFCHTDILNNNLFIQKLILYYAKKDKDIKISDEELESRIQEFLLEMKKKYINQEEFLMQFQNEEFLKKLTEEIKNQKYIEKFYDKIMDDVEITPKEVKHFWIQKQNQIPSIPKKICISYVIFHPKLSNLNKKKIIDFLNQIKKEIHSDTDFSTKAILFSEDDSSALKGGLVQGMNINNLSQEFVHLVLSLKEGEISKPFETNLGFHIMKLEKKKNDEIDFRHILVKPKFSKKELYKTKLFSEFFRKRMIHQKINLDNIQSLLKQNNIVDVIVRNSIWIEENQLSKNMKKAFFLKKRGEITNPHKEIINGKEAFVIIKLLDEKPSKPLSFEENYNLLKNFVTNVKKKEKIKNWAKEILKNTFYIKTNC
ncbi:peptidylprolyl isomerase [Blattabacterium cuenoti]|uniref:peptidylprolyl isomerase n=1 Tax=Blattabacterium cuenoti TaxID=1653831 RepID=UPI00163C61A0|nr:peptidylprolyl isomerase [Blattabacterium cuenoti]